MKTKLSDNVGNTPLIPITIGGYTVMGEQTTIFDIIENEEVFDFEGKKQNLIDNLDMLKEMSVEEQTLYKKWQEMNKGGKMSKVKKKVSRVPK